MKSMSSEATILIPHFWLVVLFVATVLVALFLAGICFLRIIHHMNDALQPSPRSRVTPLGYWSRQYNQRIAPLPCKLHKTHSRITRDLNKTVELEKMESKG